MALTIVFVDNDILALLSSGAHANELHVLPLPAILRLLGVITIQTFLYYERFSKDHISQKAVIGFLWLVQMFQVITSLYVYIWIVEHAGEPVLIKWFDTFYQLSMVICSAIVQFFFVLRLYRLSGSIWLPISLVFLTLAQFGERIRMIVFFERLIVST
ncbi:uncharacterized protein EI90DRAFT_379375 [Cantharellus anzutake]|uniref:uncharacterized protein n=1 Tax=Cantharellus anzutake TaxID=1750568 RepID=UPI0019062E59|nr:uncharacterized protein EI90DRAFT_379375 [Cantharellus anzutake]KAF8334945.1 hypothetical protein EI90DRAFT_379375 [Cantharellus anzutake]